MLHPDCLPAKPYKWKGGDVRERLVNTGKVWGITVGSLVRSRAQGCGHAASHERPIWPDILSSKASRKDDRGGTPWQSDCIFLRTVRLSRCIYVGRSRQAQCTIQRAKAKIFLGQKTHNTYSTYAQANTPCLKDLHLTGYSWHTSVQFRAQQEKQTVVLFGVLHLSTWC